MHTKITKLILPVVLSTFCGFSQAKEADVSKLAGPLTPMGSERMGNADGSIPTWDGGMKPGAAPIEANGNYVDPFATEKPLYTITNGNVSQYKALLTPGQQAMFVRYPDYKMNIYPSHRTARLPQKYIDQAQINAKQTELTEDGNGLKNYSFGIPFPMPTQALEVMWNHLVRYRGGSIRRQFSSATVQENGTYTLVTFNGLSAFRENLKDLEPDSNLFLLTYSSTLSPSRYAGEVSLAHDPINQAIEVRNAWQYIPGQRRVRRAPTIAYDNSARYTFGQVVSDSLDGYNGAPDKYQWTLVGKQEMLIPYNSFKLMDKNKTYDDLLKPGYVNPDMTRYEKHRVWVVEATLKPGQRHIYAKRRFYIDEDSWTIAVADIYDSRGELWRVQQEFLVPYHDAQVTYFAGEATYDLISGRYAVNNISNGVKEKWVWNEQLSKSNFTPAELKRIGK